MHRSVFCAGLVGVLLTAGSVSAKVFDRWRSPDAGGPGERFGWSFAYESKMNLNGIEGVVRVYGVEQKLAEVLADLQRYYREGGRSGEFFPGDIMAWGIGQNARQAIRYFLQEGANSSSTLVYEIAQPLAEYQNSIDRPLQHHLEAVPVYPGSAPAYFMHDYGTATALEVSRTTASPEAVTEFYHQSLSNQGWRARLGDAGSMRIFEKGQELVLISAGRGTDGKTRITRVHKTLKVK